MAPFPSNNAQESSECERYLQLPIEVRRLLERMTAEEVRAAEDFLRMSPRARKWWLSLDDQDVETIEKLLGGYRNVGTIGRFLRYVFGGMILIFMAMSGVIEKFFALLKTFGGK